MDEKKNLLKQIKALKRARTSTLLRCVFNAWCERNHGQETGAQTWLKLHDHAMAITLLKLKKHTAKVIVAVRTEDAAFYQQMATEAGRTYSAEGLTGVWKRIKAVLPKNRLKAMSISFDIKDEMQHHFEQLEAGRSMSEDELRKTCCHTNHADVLARPQLQILPIQELPTRLEVEELCLKQKPHRAAGPDGIPPDICRLAAPSIPPGIHNVLLKSFLSIEPCRYKGGNLVAFWKQKGSQRDPAMYRGILLADTDVKVLHGWSRRRLLPTLITRRARGQIGGLPAQQTITAMHLLRLHGGRGRHMRLSTAVLFIDLKARSITLAA